MNIEVINDGLPEPLYQAIINHKYDRGRADETPSSLNQPVYQRAVMNSLPEGTLKENATDCVWRMLGETAHVLAERGAEYVEGYEAERRFYGEVEVGGKTITIGAQVDLLDHTKNAIHDFKTTSAYGFTDWAEPKPEWIQQLNVGRWCIWKETGQVVDSLHIIGILRDWSKGKVFQKGYPNKQVKSINLPVWSLEDTEAWIVKRVAAHMEAKGKPLEEVPECSPGETWERPTVYAVMKEGRKSAVKLFEKEKEAKDFLETLDNKHRIDLRKGQRVRCEDYCACSEYCPSFQKYKSENE